MSLARSRRIPRVDLEAWQTEQVHQAEAKTRADLILEEARVAAATREEEQRAIGRQEAETELAAQVIQAYQARDATLAECKESCLRILADACQRVLGQGDWDETVHERVDTFLMQLRSRERLRLQTPKKPSITAPPWVEWLPERGDYQILDGDLQLALNPDFRLKDLLTERCRRRHPKQRLQRHHPLPTPISAAAWLDRLHSERA